MKHRYILFAVGRDIVLRFFKDMQEREYVYSDEKLELKLLKAFNHRNHFKFFPTLASARQFVCHYNRLYGYNVPEAHEDLFSNSRPIYEVEVEAMIKQKNHHFYFKIIHVFKGTLFKSNMRALEVTINQDIRLKRRKSFFSGSNHHQVNCTEKSYRDDFYALIRECTEDYQADLECHEVTQLCRAPHINLPRDLESHIQHFVKLNHGVKA